MQDRQLLRSIRAVRLQSREAYGAYKTWRVLRAKGVACGRQWVARLRRQNGIEARRKRRFRVVVEHHKLAPRAPNRLAQRFHVTQPDRVWAGDMTVIPTSAGWLHLDSLSLPRTSSGVACGRGSGNLLRDDRWSEAPGMLRGLAVQVQGAT